MKNKIALASAFVAASSLATAEIVINDFLSFEGFVDMSYNTTESSTSSNVGFNADGNQNSYAIDQVEISWLFKFDPVTAQIDLAHEGSDSPRVPFIDASVVEQAFATYSFDNGSAITAGRFASMLGFEAFEPTGLYQYSTAYALTNAGAQVAPGINVGNVSILPGYYEGVKYTYETESSFFGIALVDTVSGAGTSQLGGNNGASSYGVEAAGSFILGEGLSLFVGGVYEDVDAGGAAGSLDRYVLNTYVTFETGAWIFAGELNYGDADGAFVLPGIDEEVLQGLLMANFAYSDAASVTGRLSYSTHESSVGPVSIEADFLKYTIAHGYAFTDNLFLVTEISYVDGEFEAGPANSDTEGFEAAVELIFSF